MKISNTAIAEITMRWIERIRIQFHVFQESMREKWDEKHAKEYIESSEKVSGGDQGKKWTSSFAQRR